MKKLLITGGAGNLASQLSFLLADHAERILLFDRAPAPVAATADCCSYVQGDLTRSDEMRRLLLAERPQVVLHLASLLSASTEIDRALGWRINADAFFHLMEACVEAGVGRVLFTSSLAAYGGALPDPLPEDHPQWPTSLYGVTKAACERLGVYYHARHNIDFRAIRLPIVVSRHAAAGAASAYVSRAFVETAERGGFTFRVRPEARPGAVYVRDALEGMVQLLQAPADRISRRVYNIQGFSASAAEIAAAIRARWPRSVITFELEPAVDALVAGWPAGIADDSARRDWGWNPRFDLPAMADALRAELGPGAAG